MQNLRVRTVRLRPGQELKSSLEDFVKINNFKAGFIMTCVGSVQKATLRFATPLPGEKSDSSVNERVVTFDKENFEVCSLVGTLSQEGSHLHALLSRADGTTVGGHVVGDMVVQTTAEVVIGESLEESYSRQYDTNTGYRELVVLDRTTSST